LVFNLLTGLAVPISIGFVCQRFSPRLSIRNSFILTSLVLSVLAYVDSLVTAGLIRPNPVPSPGAPSILFLIDPTSAVQGFALVGLPSGFATGAVLLVGAVISWKDHFASGPSLKELDEKLYSAVPWLVAATVPVAVLAFWDVYGISYVESQLFHSPISLYIFSTGDAGIVPISVALGYLSQRGSLTFSLKRSFVLPSVLAFLESSVLGIGASSNYFGQFHLSPVLFLWASATLVLPVALKVGGLVAAGSIIATGRDVKPIGK
jgi:hypothetical protein